LHKQQTENKHNTDSILRTGPGTRIRHRVPAQEQAPPERVRTVHTRFGGACFWAGKQPQIRGPVSRLEYGALLRITSCMRTRQYNTSEAKLRSVCQQTSTTASTLTTRTLMIQHR
jgi:hypothetical protein